MCKAPRPGMGAWLLTCACVCICLDISVCKAGGGGPLSGPPHHDPRLCPDTPAVGSQRSLSLGPRVGTLTCLNNNILRIDCHWAAPELDQGSSPWLLFSSNQEPGSQHRCVFRGSVCTVLLPSYEVLVPSDNFTITLHQCVAGQEQVRLVDQQYLPRKNVKLDPPSNLQSNISADSWVLTWSLNLALEPMASLLTYELAFKRREQAWQFAQHKDHIVGVTRVTIEAIELDPGSTYEARLRVQMATLEGDDEEERYEGQWSDWSLPVCFRSPQRRGLPIPPWGQPDSALVAVSIFVLLSGLIYLLFKLSPRVKRSFAQDVPSPAVFFRPLYSVHNGNFQTWTGAPRTSWQLSQDCVNTLQGTSGSSVWEVTTLLMDSQKQPWQSVGLQREEGSGIGLRGAPSSEEVLPAECVGWRAWPPVYLPQEDWAPGLPTGLVAPESGGGSEYCAVGCSGDCCPTVLAGDTQSSEPVAAEACSLSWDPQGLDPQPGLLCESRLE
ncbi:interleukin-9 receptor [Ochotona curzoniae]|uniref:interleukin-9 receptor n=1 Tax=Ochotona curzoniae TaxID=130825 RepID=UPI001B34EBAB|nr:interleukin-9 receptor [Ochotona curzoniae]